MGEGVIGGLRGGRSKEEGNGRKIRQNGRRRKIKLSECQTSSNSLRLRPPSILSRSFITFTSQLTGLHTLTECPLHRNTNTYTGPENNQVKNVDLATEKS